MRTPQPQLPLPTPRVWEAPSKAVQQRRSRREQTGDGYDEEDSDEESNEGTQRTEGQVEAFRQMPEGAELTSDAAGLFYEYFSRAEAGEGSMECILQCMKCF